MVSSNTNSFENGSPFPLDAAVICKMSGLGLVSRVSAVHTPARNCIRDEGGPFGFGDQELIPSHRKLLWSKAMVVSVAETMGLSVIKTFGTSEPIR